ncbi:hypothetical protein F0562_012806 [Nyssa sinensis]|uniref:Uncharacterized protein n=1 Tax=Nyssa sinensis TaxID=561372 RepID=A0A5J4ZU52_9ASTE|nr:hypothetical protein F0562_012806 [Nyssa sinensis]
MLERSPVRSLLELAKAFAKANLAQARSLPRIRASTDFSSSLDTSSSTELDYVSSFSEIVPDTVIFDFFERGIFFFLVSLVANFSVIASKLLFKIRVSSNCCYY